MAEKHSYAFTPTWGEKREGEKLSEANSCDLRCQQCNDLERMTTKYDFFMFSWSLLTATPVFSQNLLKREKKNKSHLYHALAEPYK